MPNFLENYVPIKVRLNEFRKQHPDWTIRTTMHLLDGHWHAETLITDENGHLIANGNAYEQARKPFDMEKAETSAVGRALVFAGWTDSLELSQEDRERSEGVAEQRKPVAPTPTPQAVDRGAVTPQTVKTQPPLIPADKPMAPPNIDDLLRLSTPVQSAPKPFWQEFVKELVSADQYENLGIPWRDLTYGKGFDELTTDELKHLVESVDKWLHEPEVE